MQTSQNLSAASLAGAAILLEIGAEYRVVDLLRHSEYVDVAAAETETGIPAAVLTPYFDALANAGLAERVGGANGSARFRRSARLEPTIHDVGYVSWALRACSPLIAHAREFAARNEAAQEAYPRDGWLVARTSRWMGERSFYPQAKEAILSLEPRRIVDLGSGSGGLLIELLGRLPEATGIGVDLSASATAKARAAAEAAGMARRLEFVASPIQALVEDPRPLVGADVIHAGFVFHDLLPADEDRLDALLAACRAHASSGTLVVVDAVPFAQDEWERAFSAAFTHLHNCFMSRMLLSEAAWCEKLNKAGFARIETRLLGIPGGRLFMASSA
jgi:SAM-dependent methyltransferase